MTTKDNTQDVQGVVDILKRFVAEARNDDRCLIREERDLMEQAASLLLSEHEGRVAAEALIYAPDGKTFRTALFEEAAKRGQAQARVEEMERVLRVLAKDHEATVNVWLPGDHSGSQWMGGKWVHFREFAAQALNPTGAAG